ncbi:MULTISPECIES: GPW/gp25 family protein [Bacteroides]|uniref:GPW/gp25 family protein n=1 Tax=Bacteroides TaxID=816 RepID=UPI001F1547CF|nr:MULTISPECIES: GPW/gp25 family protein [Bacteroides]MDN0066687.1 GPW/gp25 family protein [Bacteroides gallinaceum]
METKFCKLPLDFEALLNEDVGNNHLASCNEIDSIDQFIELLISTAPGEHAFDKEFGCEIFYLDFESIVSHTRWEGQFSEYITKAITRYEKRLTNVYVRVSIDDATLQDSVSGVSTIKKRVQVYVYGTLVHTGEKRCFYYVIYLGPISTR